MPLLGTCFKLFIDCCAPPTHLWAQCGGKLQREFEGAAYDVFARTLRGLAATKLTKPGTFRCTDGDGEGHALRCSFKVRITLRAP